MREFLVNLAPSQASLKGQIVALALRTVRSDNTWDKMDMSSIYILPLQVHKEQICLAHIAKVKKLQEAYVFNRVSLFVDSLCSATVPPPRRVQSDLDLTLPPPPASAGNRAADLWLKGLLFSSYILWIDRNHILTPHKEYFFHTIYHIFLNTNEICFRRQECAHVSGTDFCVNSSNRFRYFRRLISD